MGPAVPRRPLGISILAALYLAGGIFIGFIGAQAPVMRTAVEDLDAPLRAIGVSPLLVLIGIALVALLGASAAVGMWLGKNWGWWLGAFTCVYSIGQDISALESVVALADHLADSPRGPEHYYVKHVGRIVVHAFILLYFFKRNVLQFFGLEELSKWKALSGLVGTYLVIAVGVGIVAWFAM